MAEHRVAPGIERSVTKEDLSKQLKAITTSLSPQDQEATLSTLRRIFDNVIQHPNDDKYRQIKLTGKIFSSEVWQYPAGEELMKMSGWVVEGDHVRLRDDSRVQTVSQLLQQLKDTSSSSHSADMVSILDKRFRENGDQNVGTDPIGSECCALSKDAAVRIIAAMLDGDGVCLKELLKPYHTFCVKNMQVINDFMFMAGQIGIARILVKEYGVDANTLDKNGVPYFLKLFDGCISTESCQSLIIEFIKVLKLDVNKHNRVYRALHLAVMNKLFSVTKFLVEECQVDVDCKSVAISGGTPLHMAYGIGEKSIAQYLIEHGADQEALDDDGRTPKDYEFYAGLSNSYGRTAHYYMKQRVIEQNIRSPERAYFKQLCEKGITILEAIDKTYEKFPSLQKDIDGSSVNQINILATPTPKDLYHYITDMALSYYDIGLQLDIVNSKLKLIKNDPSLPDLTEKCRKMLEVWLENDTSASWKKLYDALEEVGLSVLAERIKQQYPCT